jgi:hypothetical protein
MEKKREQSIAATVGEELALFVRASPEELEASELQLVAGGLGPYIVPLG